MISISNISVMLPAYNEDSQIAEVIKSILSLKVARVVVINDGSTDTTAATAISAGALVVNHRINRGAGAGVQTGIELARSQGWPYIVFMDADGQHNPEDILKLRDRMSSQQADIVIGTRFTLGHDNDIPRSRIFYNSIANQMTNLVCRQRYSDSQSGLRLLNERAIHALNLQIDGFGFCSEMLFKAERASLKTAETPTSVLYSDYSISKGQDLQVGFTTAFNFLWNSLLK